MLYGFCVQAGLGVGLWLIVRLGRVMLSQRWVVTIGAMLWNLGVTIGVLGILGGDSTGFPFLEIPHYAAMAVFLGYLVFGAWTLVAFHQRQERTLYVSHWFLLAALFWFAWIYSTAYLLLVSFPVRGVAQAVIAWWFAQNLLIVWLGSIGLAIIFYFAPKLTTGELFSRPLALLSFWLLLLLGSWGGIPTSAPVPAWLSSLSTVTTGLTLILLLCVALNVFATLRGQSAKIKSSPPLQFVYAGFFGFLLAGVMNIAAALPPISDVTNFTWFTAAKMHANFYAFFALVAFGAVYHIMPRLAGLELCPKLMRAHWWLAVLGVLFLILPLGIGGLLQGFRLQNSSIAFLDISKGTLPFLRASTLGDVLLAAGHVIFLINVLGAVSRFSKSRAKAAYAVATADLFNPAEVKP
jgi:cytochrome c oxidase cbb3-type subunit 1